MKLKHFLPLLFLAVSFTSCVEKITRKVHQDTIPPEFSVEKETVKSRISAIIPADKINFGSTKTSRSGENIYHTLYVEIFPDTLPSNAFSFSRMTGEIQEAMESGIENMEDYQKLSIEVRRTEVENGTEHNRSYKKEIDL